MTPTPVARGPRSVAALAPIALLAACSGAGDVAPVAAGPVGWPGEVARDPASFNALMTGTSRDGWIAFHANDWSAAYAAFTGPTNALPRSRVNLELAVLHDDLAKLVVDADKRLFAAWDHHGGLPPGAAASIAALSERCNGGDWHPWAAKVAPNAPGSAWLAEPDDNVALWPPDPAPNATVTDPFAARRVLHRRARDGSPDDLVAAATIPFMLEPAAGFEREFWDPCVDRTLSDLWLSRVAVDAGVARWSDAPAKWAGAGLAGTLFAPWLTAVDLRAAPGGGPGVIAATPQSLDTAGIFAAPSDGDDVDVARDEVRRLGEMLDAWQISAIAAAPPDGAALVNDLGLMRRYRQDWLVVRARSALADGHPRQALTYAELARDPGASDIGPLNSPAVFAVLAQSQLANGHTREALDALAPLVERYPEAAGAREVVSDLAVLQGIDRVGDSKEN